MSCPRAHGGLHARLQRNRWRIHRGRTGAGELGLRGVLPQELRRERQNAAAGLREDQYETLACQASEPAKALLERLREVPVAVLDRVAAGIAPAYRLSDRASGIRCWPTTPGCSPRLTSTRERGGTTWALVSLPAARRGCPQGARGEAWRLGPTRRHARGRRQVSVARESERWSCHVISRFLLADG